MQAAAAASAARGGSGGAAAAAAHAHPRLSTLRAAARPVRIPVSAFCDIVHGVVARPARVDAVAVGDGHALALTDASRVFAWGANARGQLGLGHFSDVGAPTEVRARAAAIAAVAAPAPAAAAAAAAAAVAAAALLPSRRLRVPSQLLLPLPPGVPLTPPPPLPAGPLPL